MNRVVALFAQPRDHGNGHAHVGKESHQLILDRLAEMDLFLSEPRGVFESLLDVRGL